MAWSGSRPQATGGSHNQAATTATRPPATGGSHTAAAAAATEAAATSAAAAATEAAATSAEAAATEAAPQKRRRTKEKIQELEGPLVILGDDSDSSRVTLSLEDSQIPE